MRYLLFLPLLMISCTTVHLSDKKGPSESKCYNIPKYKQGECFSKYENGMMRCILYLSDCEYTVSFCLKGNGCVIEQIPFEEFERNNSIKVKRK